MFLFNACEPLIRWDVSVAPKSWFWASVPFLHGERYGAKTRAKKDYCSSTIEDLKILRKPSIRSWIGCQLAVQFRCWERHMANGWILRGEPSSDIRRVNSTLGFIGILYNLELSVTQNKALNSQLASGQKFKPCLCTHPYGWENEGRNN